MWCYTVEKNESCKPATACHLLFIHSRWKCPFKIWRQKMSSVLNLQCWTDTNMKMINNCLVPNVKYHAEKLWSLKLSFLMSRLRVLPFQSFYTCFQFKKFQKVLTFEKDSMGIDVALSYKPICWILNVSQIGSCFLPRNPVTERQKVQMYFSFSLLLLCRYLEKI